tara:strand:+ start:45 stop:413 length:369 start_codon:yes stop_codon:yes gene_type:complete
MTNKFRGELKVSLNNTEYKTKITLDGIMRIESETNKPVIKLANELMSMNLSMTEICTILSIAIRGGGNNMTVKQIGDIAFDAGITNCMKVCGEILTNTITGGQKNNEEDSEKNVEAESNQTD